MSRVEIIQQQGALVQVTNPDGARVEVQCTPSARVEVTTEGPQGPQGLPGAPDHIQVVFPVASGQSAFPLDYSPPLPDRTRFWVNGQRFGPPDIIVTGAMLTWNAPFTLSPNDTVEITYPSQG